MNITLKKYSLFLVALVVSWHNVIYCADTTSVLFIGNSYTYVNELPILFDSLALSGGHLTYCSESTVGGYTLQQHTVYQQTLAKIHERNWSYVVLQEQSQIPAIDYLRHYSMYPSARILDSLITLQNSHTVLYMTWGRKNGGQQCIDIYCSPVFNGFFDMQDSLKSAYTDLSAILNSMLSPVGEAWRKARQLNPNVDLWQPDESHPTLNGSYLAACVFYVTLFNESPVGLTYKAGLAPDTALFFQNVAASLIGVEKISSEIPARFELKQNYPNPFNPETTIEFKVPGSSFHYKQHVKLIVYDETGRVAAVLVDNDYAPGTYKAVWEASAYSSGIYFCRLESDQHAITIKVAVVK